MKISEVSFVFNDTATTEIYTLSLHDALPIYLGRDHEDRHTLGRQVGDELVDLGLGADVDAARRLVQDQDARVEHQAAREQRLLLVAAAQVADRLVQGRRLDPQHVLDRTSTRLNSS